MAVGHHWLRVRVVGKAPNTNAIGAMVTLTANGVTQRRLVATGASYASQGDLIQTFGLGTIDKVERLSVTWPDGRESVVSVDDVDQVITVTQDG